MSDLAIPVLLYHSVPRALDPDDDRYAVAYERFASHLDAILASGRTPLTVAEIARGLREERRLPRRAVAITFDDGYRNNAAAIDLICARGLRASVFVTTSWVGKERMLHPEQLRQLAAKEDAVEVGAHSITHPRLDELGVREVEREVAGSRRELEELLGAPVATFAYPHGCYDRRVQAAVKAAGFQGAAAVKNAASHREDDPWAIARWTVRGDTDAGEIARILDGEGVPRAWRRERWRTRGYRAARRLKRRSVRGARS